MPEKKNFDKGSVIPSVCEVYFSGILSTFPGPCYDFIFFDKCFPVDVLSIQQFYDVSMNQFFFSNLIEKNKTCPCS